MVAPPHYYWGRYQMPSAESGSTGVAAKVSIKLDFRSGSDSAIPPSRRDRRLWTWKQTNRGWVHEVTKAPGAAPSIEQSDCINESDDLPNGRSGRATEVVHSAEADGR